jgi:hypothetical protein
MERLPAGLSRRSDAEMEVIGVGGSARWHDFVKLRFCGFRDPRFSNFSCSVFPCVSFPKDKYQMYRYDPASYSGMISSSIESERPLMPAMLCPSQQLNFSTIQLLPNLECLGRGEALRPLDTTPISPPEVIAGTSPAIGCHHFRVGSSLGRGHSRLRRTECGHDDVQAV